jgi:biopolymer transport protein ExbD
MGVGTNNDDEEITGINVTPLVDVMLVLLVIFMVTATYIVNQSINVNLPKAETGEGIEKSKNLAFVIDKDANLFLNGDKISYAELPAKIATEREKKAKGPLQALIAADQDTPHGAVIKLIDAVRKNGISDFAINVESPLEENQ